LQASFTPFLTELMYQNMRHLLADEGSKAGEDTRSIHFVGLAKPREDFIHTDIESAVSKMQTVIELGRVIRDRKTMPLKVRPMLVMF
jgi:isoleucyl-tRNA synthetase